MTKKILKVFGIFSYIYFLFFFIVYRNVDKEFKNLSKVYEDKFKIYEKRIALAKDITKSWQKRAEIDELIIKDLREEKMDG